MYAQPDTFDAQFGQQLPSSSEPVTSPRQVKSGCCACKKRKKGTGDIAQALSTGDWSTLFVDPSTGGFSWTDMAIVGAIGVGLFAATSMVFGDSAKKRRAALSKARSDYNRRRAQILSQFPRFA